MSKMPNNKSASNSVNIATFNARSIRNKIHEINNFAESSSIHILAVTESWLGPSIPDARVELPNFQAPFRRDRNENGGGVSDFPWADFTCVQNKAGVRGPSPVKIFHFRVAEPPFFNSECSESGMTRNRKMVKTSPLRIHCDLSSRRSVCR